MPELPEVETIARTLAPSVNNKIITKVNLLNEKTWASSLSPESILNHKIISTSRRGKLLFLNFEKKDNNSPYALAFHLKMSGRLFAYEKNQIPEHKHIRFDFTLDDGTLIVFDDTRKFGFVRAINDAELANWKFWNNLGPEPLTISCPDFVNLFIHKSTKIKALLLDQSVIAGIGNIYADEALFTAKINPNTAGRDIPKERLIALHQAIVDVLLESIAACGSSIRDYRMANGDAGAFQNKFKVYGRKGGKCYICDSDLESCQVASRGTVFCPKCQN